MIGPLGVGTYRTYVAPTGSDGERHNDLADLTDAQTAVSWRRQLKSTSQGQGVYDAMSDATSSMIHTVDRELRIERNGVLVWEGPITRKAVKPGGEMRITAEDLSWWSGRRMVKKTIDRSQIGVGDIPELVLAAAIDIDLDEDPAMLPFVSSFSSSALAKLSVNVNEYRLASEVLSSSLTSSDWATVKRATMFGDPPVKERFPTLSLMDHIDGTPEVVERGDLYASRVVAVGADGLVASVSTSELFGVSVPRHLVVEKRVVDNEIADASSLRRFAENELRSRFPTPIEVKMGRNSTLSPAAPITPDYLIPGAVGRVNIEGFGFRQNELVCQIQSVSGSLNKGGVESIAIEVRAWRPFDEE